MGDFSQLAAVPAFVKHYQQHQDQSDSPLSVLAFWNLHYAGQKTHDHPGDPLSHQQLPLKTLQDFQWIGVRVVADLSPVQIVYSSHFQDLSDSSLPEGIRASVFRPPLAA